MGETNGETKACSICGSEIALAAQKCVHCHEFVDYPSCWVLAGWKKAKMQKTLWDVASLIIVPVLLASLVAFYSRLEAKRQNAIEERPFQEAAFYDYLHDMTDLVEKGQLVPDPDPEIQHAAQARTSIVWGQLPEDRKRLVVEFLYEACLMGCMAEDGSKVLPVVLPKGADLKGIVLVDADLRGADLSESDLVGAELGGAEMIWAMLKRADLSQADLRAANLRVADLREASLRGAHLDGAYLIWADLSKANLSGAFLSGADLGSANLSEADLSGANLERASVTQAQLDQAASLKGATLPDGTVHE
jgi:uncharacterized protein YjbI with pentapeptide repeats